jgi:hypothetical protein
LIRLARGQKAGSLSSGTVYGPYLESELPARFDEVVAGLSADGFVQSGPNDLLLKLEHEDSAARARAAIRLGWMQSREAVPPLLARIDSAVDELCSILDALGAIGDPRATEALRAQANRKLLSRRRSAVEALRCIGDTEGVNAACNRAIQQPPDGLREAVEGTSAASVGVNSGANAEAIVKAMSGVDSKFVGLYLDCGVYKKSKMTMRTYARPPVSSYGSPGGGR